MCNSDDEDGAAERGECVKSEFGYREVRILSQVSLRFDKIVLPLVYGTILLGSAIVGKCIIDTS